MKVIVKETSIEQSYYNTVRGYAYYGSRMVNQEISAWSEDGNVRMDIILCSNDGTMFPKDCDLEMEIILKATPKKSETVTLKLK